jgi:hypothetical protein
MKRTDMTTPKSRAADSEPSPRVITVKDPALSEAKLKALSRSDDFNKILASEAEAATAEVAPLYEPTPEENSALERFGTRTAEKPPAPRLKVEHNDGQLPSIRADHTDNAIGYLLLANAFGTTNLEFLDGLLSQISMWRRRDANSMSAPSTSCWP